MREPIFVINAGSSSIEFSLYQTTSNRSVEAGAHGQVEGIGTSPRLKVTDVQGRGYVDVAVRRWQAFTGKTACLLGDGRSFDVVAGERLNTSQS
jgi:acetate kinase